MGVEAQELLRRIARLAVDVTALLPAALEPSDRLPRMNPFERLGTPEEIAAAVSFLVGADGGWINGQVLRANGGRV